MNSKTEDKKIKAQQDHNNLVGFFDLLLKIDKRNNPERYKLNIKKKKDD